MLQKLLSESSDLSMMRAMSLVCIVTASLIALVCLFTNKSLSDCAILVTAFLVPAFGGKVIQASIEK